MSFVPRSDQELALEWPPELDHFSASGAKMAVRCAEQWRQRYVLGKRQPPNLSMLEGRADHAAIEKSMLRKIETFTDLPVADVREAYVAALEEDVAYYGGLSEIEIEERDGVGRYAVYDHARKHGQKVVEVYHRNVSPTLQPQAVEKEFSITLPQIPVPVVGRIDLIAQNAKPSLLEPDPRIIDRKRVNRMKAKPGGEWELQAEVYQVVEPLPHEWHLSSTGKYPVCKTDLRQELPPRERSVALLTMIVQQIAFYMSRYGPDEVWPGNGRLHPWSCSYCGYRPQCAWWRE